MATGKVIIKSENRMSDGIKSAKKDLEGFSKYAKSMSDSLKGLFAIESLKIATSAIKKMTDSAKECVKIYQVQEKAEVKLNNALRATGSYSKSLSTYLKDMASELQSVTTYGDEAILEMQSVLIETRAVTEETMKPVMEAVLDMSEAVGIDGVSAAKKLARALTDPKTGLEGLKEANINLTEEQKNEIKTLQEQGDLLGAQKKIIAAVEKSYGGLAKAVAETDTGKLAQIAAIWGDVKETFGQALLDSLSPTLDWLLETLKKVQEYTNNWKIEADFKKGLDANKLASRYSRDSVVNYRSEVLKRQASSIGQLNKAQVALANAEAVSDGTGDATFLAPFLDDVTRWEEEVNKSNKELNLIYDVLKLIDDKQRPILKLAESSKSGSKDDEEEVVEEGTKKAIESTFGNVQTLDEIIASLSGHSMTAQITTLENQIKSYENQLNALYKEDEYDLTLETALKETISSLSTQLSELRFGKPEEEKKTFDVEEPSFVNFTEMFDKYVRQASYQEEKIAAMYDELYQLSQEFAALPDDIKDLYRDSYTQIENAIKDGISKAENPPSLFEAAKGGFKEQFSSFFSKGASDSSILGSLGESFNSLMKSVGPLAQIFTSSNPIIATLKVILEGLLEILQPAIETVISPIMDCLKGIGKSLGEMLLPILDALYPIFSNIAMIISTAVSPAMKSLEPAIWMITSSISFLQEPLQLFGKGVTGVSAAISWVMESVKYVVGSFTNWLRDIKIFGHRIFHIDKVDVSNPGSITSYIKDAIKDYDRNMSGVSATAATDSVSTSSAVSNATYTGSTNVTINIYQEAPVVGDGGMNAFAGMIRDKFEELAYFNA